MESLSPQLTQLTKSGHNWFPASNIDSIHHGYKKLTLQCHLVFNHSIWFLQYKNSIPRKLTKVSIQRFCEISYNKFGIKKITSYHLLINHTDQVFYYSRMMSLMGIHQRISFCLCGLYPNVSVTLVRSVRPLTSRSMMKNPNIHALIITYLGRWFTWNIHEALKWKTHNGIANTHTQ